MAILASCRPARQQKTDRTYRICRLPSSTRKGRIAVRLGEKALSYLFRTDKSLGDTVVDGFATLGRFFDG
jgi:hypothetical protein